MSKCLGDRVRWKGKGVKRREEKKGTSKSVGLPFHATDESQFLTKMAKKTFNEFESRKRDRGVWNQNKQVTSVVEEKKG